MNAGRLIPLIYFILPDPIKGPSLICLSGILLTWATLAYRSGRVPFYGAVELTLEDDGGMYWFEVAWRFLGGLFFAYAGIRHFFT